MSQCRRKSVLRAQRPPRTRELSHSEVKTCGEPKRQPRLGSFRCHPHNRPRKPGPNFEKPFQGNHPDFKGPIQQGPLSCPGRLTLSPLHLYISPSLHLSCSLIFPSMSMMSASCVRSNETLVAPKEPCWRNLSCSNSVHTLLSDDNALLCF